jgi:hypothetical protein
MAHGSRDRKPRVQGKIAKLPPTQQSQLRAWMNEGLTYKEIKKRARDQFGVSISQGSLSIYYSKHQREIIAETAAFEVTPCESLHVRLVFHVEIRPELICSSVS